MPEKERDTESSLRGLGINLLLCIASISGFFGSAELLARFWYNPQKVESEIGLEFDSEKFFRQKGNFNGIYFGVPFTTNSYGYRGSEITMEKPKNTFRVLLLGDSVAFGTMVRDDENFPYLLEQNLNQYLGDKGTDLSLQVINAAVPGNSSFQEYYDLKRGLNFNPDAILLQFTLNDVTETQALWIFRTTGFTNVTDSQIELNEYVLGHRKIPATFRIDNFLRQHSAFYLFLKDMQSRLRFQDPSGESIRDIAQQQEIASVSDLVDNPESPATQAAWERTLGWLEKIADLAEERNIPLIILVTPFDFQITQEQESAYPQKIMESFSRKRGILFVDLLEILQSDFAASTGRQQDPKAIIRETIGQEPEKLQEYWSSMFYDVCHALPKGHEFIARILQPTILEILFKEHKTDVSSPQEAPQN